MKKNLTALFLLAVVLTVNACGTAAQTPAETKKEEEEKNTAAIVETEAGTEEARPAVNLPDDLDFGGAEFHSYAWNWQGYPYYFFADEENGDIMNDAIYERTRNVEERLNVEMLYEYEGEGMGYVPTKVKKAVKAGEDTVQHALLHTIEQVAGLVSGGYLYNLDEMPMIDMNAEWWNKEQMDVLRLGENTYYAVNDYMVPCPYVIYFSKEQVANLDFDDPYQLVYDGKWTIDAFIKMTKEATADLDGDGKMDWQTDRFGISTEEHSKLISFIIGAGQTITEKNSDGKMELSMNTEKMQKLVEIFADLGTGDVYYMPQTADVSLQLEMDTGRVMFLLATLPYAERMRNCEVDFGLVPYPKFDEAQESYRTFDWGGLLAIPTTVANPEMVGAVTEFLAYDSGNNVLPTYYKTILTGKLVRDADAEKMLDIVFDTICYEPGINYFGFSGGFGSLIYTLSELALFKGSTDYASYYAKQENMAAKILNSFYNKLEDAESN